MELIRIMFVCHGNICRSPMAEFIMKDIVRKNGMEDDFYIQSAATSAEEIWRGKGNPVYPPAKRELEKHGIFSLGKTAVQLSFSDGDRYDLFIGMDSMNIRNMKKILDEPHHDKIHKLMEYTGSGADVTDPWFSGDFETAYSDIYEGCTALFEYLTK